MRRREGETGPVRGGRVVVALGAVYVTLAAVRGALVVSEGARLPGQLLNFLLVAAPSLALAYLGYRLPRSDLPPDVSPRIAGWSLLGGGVMTAVILVVEFTPGSGIEYLWLAILLFGALGSLGGFGIGLQEARALTQAREAERQRQAVEEYSRRLERQNERLESFAGMLAHELRNPLNVAQIYLQRLEGDPEDVAEVESGLDRIEEMIDILLVTVRGSEANVDWKPVSLADVTAAAWSDLSPDEAELVVATDQTIRADPVHVRHLFRNLFSNALEHGDPTVTVRVGSLETGVGFYVEDDGPGIPEDDRESVVQAGYTTKSGGLGLGLAFVANLVDTYGWDWTIAESAAGGARFEFSGVDVVTAAETRPR
ncbi:sensor histidine kinase [Halorussus sp. AFM4]|uniref:sensor histidine kinase n=1 Tax=Halorussus sp. AFM4 TaxID=3421651 RepID=UPI003EB9B2C6